MSLTNSELEIVAWILIIISIIGLRKLWFILFPESKSGIDKTHFSWDENLRNDNSKLIDFLNRRFSFEWLKTAQIKKTMMVRL